MFAPDFCTVMKVAKTLADFESARKSLGDKTVGFVPTMGALHEGHASLIRRAVAECDAVVVSDFVNPTQFNNKTDFETYPRILDQDCAFVEALGAAVLFAPRVEDIYPAGTDYDKKVFDLGGLDSYGEGPRRPGHFNGMAQVVTRLFDIVRPDRAYFGEKDYQQLAIIEYFVKALHYPIEIVRCPIARAEDGLALSSRNKLLSPAQRAAAPPYLLQHPADRGHGGENAGVGSGEEDDGAYRCRSGTQDGICGNHKFIKFAPRFRMGRGGAPASDLCGICR